MKTLKQKYKAGQVPRRNSGQAMLIAVVFFLVISLIIIMGIATPIIQQVKNSTELIRSKETYFLAQGALEDAMYKLKYDKTVTSGDTVNIGGNSAIITLTSTPGGKTVNATANIGGRVRKMEAKIVEGTRTSFKYGVQSGTGGFTLLGGSRINGDVYSNGSISALSGVVITGSATAANSAALTADQSNNSPLPIVNCTSSTCVSFRNTSGTQDIAQSFRVSSNAPLNKIQFYIKKVGSPSNATVRIVTNSASNLPSTNNLLATNATLSTSIVTSSFGWVDVPFPNSITLDPNQTYWVVIDNSSQSTNNYYVLGANSSYGNGSAKIGKYAGTWNDTNPSGLDIYFQLYLGGFNSTIGGGTYVGAVNIGTAGVGDAWAHTVSGGNVAGMIYCQTGSDNNKTCDTSKDDPPSITMPISDSQVQLWKNEATIPTESGWTYNGNLTIGWQGTTTESLKRVTGNLTIDGGGVADFSSLQVDGNVTVAGGGLLKVGPMKVGGTLIVGSEGMTLKGTLWVVGSITVSSGSVVRLDASYGASSGVIMSDDVIVLSGGGDLYGSGQSTSFPLVITTSNCPVGPSCAGRNAIEFGGGSGAVVLYSQNGTLHMSGGTSARSLSANKTIVDGGAVVNYDPNIANLNFSNGPSGEWNVTSWQEVQ